MTSACTNKREPYDLKQREIWGLLEPRIVLVPPSGLLVSRQDLSSITFLSGACAFGRWDHDFSSLRPKVTISILPSPSPPQRPRLWLLHRTWHVVVATELLCPWQLPSIGLSTSFSPWRNFGDSWDRKWASLSLHDCPKGKRETPLSFHLYPHTCSCSLAPFKDLQHTVSGSKNDFRYTQDCVFMHLIARTVNSLPWLWEYPTMWVLVGGTADSHSELWEGS